MNLTLSDDARKQSVASIKRYFAEELDQDIGDLKAGAMLGFFLKEIAPTVYNGAIADAQTYLRDRVAALEGACSVAAFGYWPSSSVRRARGWGVAGLARTATRTKSDIASFRFPTRDRRRQCRWIAR